MGLSEYATRGYSGKAFFTSFRSRLKVTHRSCFLLPPEPLKPAYVSDYREELVLFLSTACAVAANSIKKARRYKAQYDKTRPVNHRVGGWVLVRFPHEESGRRNSHAHGTALTM